jgi:WD40 repeat protein
VNERRLQGLLHALPLPDEAGARDRCWAVVREAFAAREPVPWPRRHARPLLAAVVVAALAAGFASPPGRAVLGSIRDAVGREKVVGVRRAAPALVSLPAPGRLLVTAPSGPWIVRRDGTKRRLGPYGAAGWSPHGLFVVVSRGRELIAVDPDGNVRWTLAQRRPVGLARWSPDGYRIAYLAGSALHVVAGDSTGDHALADIVARVAPAWRPAAGHVLSFVDRAGVISTYGVDSARLLWRARPPQPPRALLWSPDGRYLLSTGRSTLTLYRADGTAAGRILRRRAAIVGAAFSPDGGSLAFVERGARGSTLWLVRPFRPAPTAPSRVFAGGGSFSGLAWSPGGRWLLLGWKSADQWLFIRAAGAQKLLAVSDIARQFDPGAAPRSARFPTLDGWCCTGAGRAG